MTTIIPMIIILGLAAVAYFAFMKFYYPKMKAQYEESSKAFEEDWSTKKGEIIGEYFSNMDKFGLIKQVVKDDVLGVCTANLDKSSIISSGLEMLKSAVTLTSKVDMSHSYLVVTEKEMHFVRFDGEKCFLHEVFSYGHIKEKELTEDRFNFLYKGDKLKFWIDEPTGYPRFKVHERFRQPTANDRTRNYFVREYLAYEHLENQSYKNSEAGASKYMKLHVMEFSKEKFIDMEVRKYLLNEFKLKINNL